MEEAVEKSSLFLCVLRYCTFLGICFVVFVILL